MFSGSSVLSVHFSGPASRGVLHFFGEKKGDIKSFYDMVSLQDLIRMGVSVMNRIMIDRNTKIICGEEDHEGLKIVAEWVREDIRRVFGEPDGAEGIMVIVGTMGKSEVLNKLCGEGTVNNDGLCDETGAPKWEVYKKTLTDSKTVVIQGSDKRGAMYGILSVSEACGVSPFVNWSDAAPAHKDSVKLSDDFFGVSKEPSVKYRGIFINDEWPAFGSWATKRFGGFNAKCYAEIFELLVRMHANYMWPAMWSSNFSMDGPGLASAVLADKLGIVMSTSHHEPCMRTGEEYRLGLHIEPRGNNPFLGGRLEAQCSL